MKIKQLYQRQTNSVGHIFSSIMPRTIQYTLIISSLIFLCWYLPTSFFNVYACDDYWHGANVHEYGFWNTQIYYWNYWEGSYTHTFLATLPHVFDITRIEFICNTLTLVSILFSIGYFIRSFTLLSYYDSFICSLYFVAALYLFTSGDSEIRYWVCANTTYLMGVSTTLLYVALYHSQIHTKHKLFIQLLLVFLIVGNKISFATCAMLLMIMDDMIYGKHFGKKNKVLYFAISMFFLFNICAPGNFLRLEENMSNLENQMTFFESVCNRLHIVVPGFISSLVLVPLALVTSKAQPHIHSSQIVYATMFLLVLFFSDTCIMYTCFNNCGPLRGNILIDVFIMLYVWLLLHTLIIRIRAFTLITKWSPIFICIILHLSIPEFLLIAPSVYYSQKARERNEMAEGFNGEHVVLECLPPSYLLLSYYSNDIEWLENVYMPYFNKKIKVHLKE